MVAAQVVKEYLGHWPDLPTKTLADKIHNEHPLLFKSAESTRTMVRGYRGQKGAKGRKELADKKFVKPLTYDTNPFKLPKSYQTAPAIYNWPVTANRVGIISDLHIPYHDIPALTETLRYLKQDFKANGILINGDLIDFHGLSRFQKDPEKRTVKQEVIAAIKILKIIRKMFPKAHIVYLKGNHCVRWEHWMMGNAAHLYDDNFFSLEYRLGTAAMNIEILADSTVVKMSGLRVLHGHTVTRSMIPAVNAARGLFLKIKQSGIIGHVHKVSEHNETNIDGKLITTWSTGCLCELTPGYSPHANNYSHGFATCEIKDDTLFSVKNYRVFEGKIL